MYFELQCRAIKGTVIKEGFLQKKASLLVPSVIIIIIIIITIIIIIKLLLALMVAVTYLCAVFIAF